MKNEISAELSAVRRVILTSQHLTQRSTESIETIVSDICGLQYDPNPTVHLNHYMMLWNRKLDFTPEELDSAAYRDFRITEAFAFKRNMFFVPTEEFAIYRAALQDVVRWRASDASWLASANTPEDLAAEAQLKEGLRDAPGLTTNRIWEHLHLSAEWDAYVRGRRTGDLQYEKPIFRALYRLKRKTDLVTCGRNPGTFKEPLYILKENIGIREWPGTGISKHNARLRLTEKLISAFGVTYPVHLSHITGIPTVEITPLFSELEERGTVLPFKFGRKTCYIHSSNAALLQTAPDSDLKEVRLISPMDTLVRDQAWLKTFFDYSFTFEYFRKKGMKWPLSILVGNHFVGYLDCKMEWKTKTFIVKEQSIFDSAYTAHKGIETAITELAAFHNAKSIRKG